MEITIHGAPRSVAGLQQLTCTARCRLHELLEAEAEGGLEPNMQVFRELPDVEQCRALLQMLLDFDKANSGYAVISVTLPVRTNKESVNKKRWEEFGGEVEQALNAMHDADMVLQPLLQVPTHGVLVVGYRQSAEHQIMEVKAIPLPSFLVRELMSSIEPAGKAEIALGPFKEKMIELARAAQGVIASGMPPEKLKEVMADAIKDVDDIHAFRKIVSDEKDRHKKHCDEDGCVVESFLDSILGALDDRIKSMS